MKDTSTRRVVRAVGDGTRGADRVAHEYAAQAEIRVAPDPLDLGGPAVQLRMERDGSWRVQTQPNGSGGYAVRRASGVLGGLGGDPADVPPDTGDVVEIVNTTTPYTRRVTACDPDAIPDGGRAAWLGRGTVTTDDGGVHAMRDVVVVARAERAPAASVAGTDTGAERAFAALTDVQRGRLLREVFEILEYDEEGRPGSEWRSDTMQALGELFNRYGVLFTEPT